MEEMRLTIEEWELFFQVKILDPDGFDRKNPNLYNEKFTCDEFKAGLERSTQRPLTDFEEWSGQYQRIINQNFVTRNEYEHLREINSKCIACGNWSDLVKDYEKKVAELESQLTQARKEVEQMDLIINEIYKIAHNSPELNMGNYQEEQVEKLNNDMLSVFGIINAFVVGKGSPKTYQDGLKRAVEIIRFQITKQTIVKDVPLTIIKPTLNIIEDSIQQIQKELEEK